ncbi:MAG: AmmeMemoRadiSam system protein B, partial [Desulfovibrio sp.]|nr:AmmeMemoRadiSam system protein B [Desulfovibrio sp.]
MDSQIIREPVAIGRFYPQNKEQIAEVVPAYFAKVRPQIKDKPAQPWAVLLPHAGYFYCGEVLAATLTDLELPETIMLICPNHTGRGKAFGVWP